MIPDNFPVTSPSSDKLTELCVRLEQLADANTTDSWPKESLQLCAEYGVFSWFIERRFGGQQWNSEDIAKGYLQLGTACLCTTFVITQRTAATRRIEASQNETLKEQLLPKLSCGEISSTVGISHLTTSRQHMARPVLRAEPATGGYLINGFSPWVTGNLHADKIVMGATMEDGRQLLFVVDQEKVRPNPPHQLMALSGSCTGSVTVEDLLVPESDLIGGPVEQVMKSAQGGMTGGLQTSTLAIALANAAVKFITAESETRSDLRPTADEFEDQLVGLRSKLFELANGNAVCSMQDLRTEANSLVLRSTQAALVAAKGAGFVQGHRVGRWCREAMFFLVWSCPQPVLEANLCELAGVEI